MLGNGKKIFQKATKAFLGCRASGENTGKEKHLFLPFLVFSPCAWKLCRTAWKLCRTAWELCRTALELYITAWKSCGKCLRCYQRELDMNIIWKPALRHIGMRLFEPGVIYILLLLYFNIYQLIYY